MTDIITPSNITFVLGMLAIVFSVYNYFKNPQINSEKNDALLEQKVQWEKESNDKRFLEYGTRLDTATTMAQNHIHTVDVKVDALIKTVGEMDTNIGKELTRLATIIDERIPRIK